jgi:type IV secretion system protein VirB10
VRAPAEPGGFGGDSDAAPARASTSVRGERGEAMVRGVHSLQAHVGSMLAVALVIGLGAAALTYYYAHAFTRPARARQSAQSAASSRAQGDLALPALGPISAPERHVPPQPAAAAAAAAEPALSELPLEEANRASAAAMPSTKSAGELAFERRLAGVVFARESASTPADLAPSASGNAGAVPGALPTSSSSTLERGAAGLATLLTPTLAGATQAQRFPDQRLLLPKGAFIDCTLETAIDSSLPGMTTCVTATDTFSADGKVVLLERGTKLVGETRGQVQQGQARLFVLWTQARTPAGVITPLDSPGTDELGRSGLSGEVQRHFWQRFGAAILISVIDGAIQAGVQAASHPNGTVIYAPSGSQDIATEALKGTAEIPPTITKNNGDRIQVLVARDIDFRPVYELRVAGR